MEKGGKIEKGEDRRGKGEIGRGRREKDERREN